jgi:hypothetical protein
MHTRAHTQTQTHTHTFVCVCVCVSVCVCVLVLVLIPLDGEPGVGVGALHFVESVDERRSTITDPVFISRRHHLMQPLADGIFQTAVH